MVLKNWFTLANSNTHFKNETIFSFQHSFINTVLKQTDRKIHAQQGWLLKHFLLVICCNGFFQRFTRIVKDVCVQNFSLKGRTLHERTRCALLKNLRAKEGDPYRMKSSWLAGSPLSASLRMRAARRGEALAKKEPPTASDTLVKDTSSGAL